MPSTTIQIRAEDKTKAAFRQITNRTAKLNQSFGGLAGSMKGLAGAIGPLIGIAGFGAMAKSLLTIGDRLDKVAIQTGLNVEELQALQFAASQSGVSTETFNSSLNKFNRVLGEAASGMKKSEDAYKKLGIQIKKDDGSLKKSSTLLLEVSDRFKLIRDPAMKAKVAADLFGRSGIDLIPMLTEGSNKLLEYEYRLREAGGIMNSAATTDMAKFNDSLDLLGRVTMANFAKILVPILPALTLLAGNFDNIAKFIGIAAGAFAVAKIPVLIGAITTGVSALTVAVAANPIGAIAVGITAIGGALYTYSDDIFDFFGITSEESKTGDIGKTAKAVNELKTQVDGTAIVMGNSAHATNTNTNQLGQLESASKNAATGLAKAAEEAGKLTAQQDINLNLIAETAGTINEKGAPALWKLKDAIKDVDKQAKQGKKSNEFLASSFNKMFVDMALATDAWTDYIGRGFNFLLEETIGVEFFNRLDFIFLTKLRSVGDHFNINIDRMILAVTGQKREDLVSAFDGIMWQMTSMLETESRPTSGGIVTQWSLLLADMVTAIKTTQAEVPELDSSSIVTASQRIAAISNQVKGLEVKTETRRQGRYHSAGYFGPPQNRYLSYLSNEDNVYTAQDLSGGQSTTARTTSETIGRSPMSGGSSALESTGGNTPIQVNIYDGTGQRISAYDSAIRVEIQDRANRYNEFAALQAA